MEGISVLISALYPSLKIWMWHFISFVYNKQEFIVNRISYTHKLKQLNTAGIFLHLL